MFSPKNAAHLSHVSFHIFNEQKKGKRKKKLHLSIKHLYAPLGHGKKLSLEQKIPESHIFLSYLAENHVIYLLSML